MEMFSKNFENVDVKAKVDSSLPNILCFTSSFKDWTSKFALGLQRLTQF